MILKAFKFEKPLTSIEIYSKKTKKVKDFIERIKEFFFTETISSNHEIEEILISRFKNIVHVAAYFRKNHNFVDEYADLAGILFGYSPKEVAKYCSKKRLNPLKLVK